MHCTPPLYVIPMTLLEEIENYWDMRSNGFSSAVMEEMTDRGAGISEGLMKDLEIRPGSRVLDLGCGPGLFSILLAKKGMDVVGIDYSAAMVKKAEENASEEGVSCQFIKMNAQDLAFEDNEFDAVVSRSVIWALERPRECYREILRVLKPECRAMIMDGNYYLHLFNEDYRWKPPAGERAPGKDYHSRHNTDNVDFKIIEELAKSLPLSHEERPAWDVNTLAKLGCNDIHLQFPKDTGRIDRSKAIPSFKIIFKKEQ